MPDGSVPVLVSADTANLVRAEASALLSYLRDHPSVAPGRIAGMLFRTRPARRHRALAMVVDHDGLVAALQSVVDGRPHDAVVRTETPATTRINAFVLPGQGGQRPGMGALYYDTVPAFRAEIERCHSAFVDAFGESPLGYVLGSEADDSTTVIQSALFMQMVALGAMWRSVGVDADAVVGHSQGEIAGAYLSAKMTLDDAVLIVGTRARAVEKISSDGYAMAVVGADRDTCERGLARQSGWAQVSVVNSPRMVGISGERATVQATVDALAAEGRFTRIIPVRYPAHTSMVNALCDTIEAAVHERLRHDRFLHSDIACIGSTLGEPVPSDVALAEYWFWNLRNTVRFDQAVTAALGRGVDSFIELAEHPTLQFALQENLDALSASAAVVGTSERHATGLGEFSRNVAAVAVGDIDYPWDRLRTEPAGAPSLPLLDFPNTQMNESTLWLPYHGANEPAPAPPPDAGTRPQVIVEDWIPLTRRSTAPPRTLGIIAHGDGTLDLARALCAHADEQGLSARLVASPEDGLDAHVVLTPPFDAMSQAEAADHVSRFFTDRAWLRADRPPNEIWLVTVGGERVLPVDGPAHPVPAAIGAGFRCVGAEYPDAVFRHLDLSHEHVGAPSAEAIIAALHTADEPELALRGGGLYAKRLVTIDADVTPAPLAGRHVLITGGTGGVGLEFCEYAARNGAHRITLVNRSGKAPERMTTIRPSANIRVVRCDVADPDDVRRLADEITGAPVDVVVHAVMEAADAALADLTEQKLNRALRGKAVGIAHVLDAVALGSDCRIVLCSSTASVLGGRGKIAYAAANRMLDAYAQHLRAEGRDCVAVQWGQWAIYRGQDDTDLSNLAKVGYLPMRSIDAIPLGISRLPVNAMVAAFDWDKTRKALGVVGYAPTLSALETPQRVPENPADGTDPAERMLALLADVLGADDPQALDSSMPLVALGLDSLTALHLRRQIKAEFDCEVAVSDLLGGMTLDDVAAALGGRPSSSMDAAAMSSARADLDLFGLRAMWRVLAPVLDDGGAHTVYEIADRSQFAQRHRWVLRQWLQALTERGHLRHDAGGYRAAAEVPSPARPDLVAVCSDLGYPPQFGQFLDAANAALPDLVADRVSVQELLFPNGSMKTADAFYRDNAISRYVNRTARDAVADAVRRLAADRAPVRILELGAGVGGMTDDIAAGLTGLPVDYHFTDVSAFFLTAAQERYARHPWMRFGLVDLNADLSRQPPCDIVVAANVVHNAQDVGRTLRELHDLVRPGGALVFIEVCQAHCSFMTSVYFLMSPAPGQQQVGLTDVRAGTDRIFLTRDEWHYQLAESGFTPALTSPNAEHPLSLLDQYVFVAHRA